MFISPPFSALSSQGRSVATPAQIFWVCESLEDRFSSAQTLPFTHLSIKHPYFANCRPVLVVNPTTAKNDLNSATLVYAICFFGEEWGCFRAPKPSMEFRCGGCPTYGVQVWSGVAVTCEAYGKVAALQIGFAVESAFSFLVSQAAHAENNIKLPLIPCKKN